MSYKNVRELCTIINIVSKFRMIKNKYSFIAEITASQHRTIVFENRSQTNRVMRVWIISIEPPQ